MPLPPKLLKREAALRNDPTSEWRHGQVLGEYFTEDLQTHPRRIEHIAEYVRRFPRTPLARCPIAHVSKELSPVAFAQIHREWQAQVDAHPDDSEITRVASYLQACQAFWDIETLDAWITDVRAERVPEFEEE